MTSLDIGISGCAGRMGRMLVVEASSAPGCRVVVGSEAKGHPALGRDLGELAGIGTIGVPVSDDPRLLFRLANVVIDFSTPDAAIVSARSAAENKKPLLLGTTGLDTEQGDAVRAAAKIVPIVWPPNTSLGITLLVAMVEDAARRLGPEWDIEIVEMHHKHKVDAPSGTALALGQRPPRDAVSTLQKTACAAATALPAGAEKPRSASRRCAAAMLPAITR